MKSNEKEKDNVCYAQPKTIEQRVAIANDFTQRFKFTVPFGIDEMSNAANDAYAAWPERLYVVDENGRVSYKGGMGPFGYEPKEVRLWLAKRFGEVKHPEAKPATAPPVIPAAPADSAPSTRPPLPRRPTRPNQQSPIGTKFYQSRETTETPSILQSKSPRKSSGLARALSKLGFCSRTQAFGLIREGQVRVDGTITRNPETPVRIGISRIEVEGQKTRCGPKNLSDSE